MCLFGVAYSKLFQPDKLSRHLGFMGNPHAHRLLADEFKCFTPLESNPE